MHWFSLPRPRAALYAAALLVCGAIVGAPQPATALDDAARKEIEGVIRDYLLANPELMVEVQSALEAKRDSLRLAQQKKTLSEMKDLIYSSPNDVHVGSPDAKMTVVEFFDYNCTFCARALDDMNRLVAQDSDLRFIMKEYPILSRQSEAAHRISLAVARLMPEKYAEFHRDLLGSPGQKDGDMALELAVKLGGDRDAVIQESQKPEIQAIIQQSYQLAEGLGISGTPSYVIGDEVVFGAVGFDQLEKKVANVRACGSTTC